MEEGLVISDFRQTDAPIVYVNEGFLRLTGYAYDEIIGRNCRFLQYEKTDVEELQRLRYAISEGEPITVELWNRARDGREFLNRLSLVPVYGNGETRESKAPSYYVGIQSDITDLRLAQERSARLDTLQITMRTVNDIVMNAFNGLQSFRESLKTVSHDDGEIEQFDAIVGDAVRKLRQIEALRELNRDTSRGVDILKYQ